MMHRVPTVVLGRKCEQRKIDDPQEIELVVIAVRQSSLSSTPRTRRRMRPSTFAGGFPLVRAEQNQVAFLNRSRSRSAAFSASLKNFTMGDFHSPFFHFDERQPFRAEALRVFRHLFDLPCVTLGECLSR